MSKDITKHFTTPEFAKEIGYSLDPKVTLPKEDWDLLLDMVLPQDTELYNRIKQQL